MICYGIFVIIERFAFLPGILMTIGADLHMTVQFDIGIPGTPLRPTAQGIAAPDPRLSPCFTKAHTSSDTRQAVPGDKFLAVVVESQLLL